VSEQFDRAAILQEIIELTGCERRRPDSITIGEYAQATGCSDQSAGRRLRALVDSGILKTSLVVERGRRVRQFWKVAGNDGPQGRVERRR
jgi:DNA-binding Lrp family transcriptional regulator